MAGMIGITASIPTSTTRANFLSLWSTQTASDNKFAPVHAAGGQLDDADFSLPPGDLHVYYAYVSAVNAMAILGENAECVTGLDTAASHTTHLSVWNCRMFV